LQTRAWRCIKVTSHSPPLRRRFYRHPPPYAGESKVSGRESKVSRRVLLPRSSRAPLSQPENGLSLFLVAFSRLLFCVTMVEPPVSYLEVTVRTATCEMAIVFGSAGGAFLARRVLFLRPPSPSYATSSAPPLLWQNRRS
jgi:hypothetical protein